MNKILLGLVSLTLVLAMACTDILETDISEEEITILLPLDSTTSTQAVQTFWWEALDGATSYQLTIVSPDFANIQKRVLDATITDGTSLDTTLADGTYQWTLIGKNSGYETKKKIYTLFVESDTSNDLSTKTILLTAPDNDLVTNEATITFKWDEMPNADQYTLQVASPDFSDNGNILLNELLEDNDYSSTFSEGTYRWRVRGENNRGVSPYSERGFTIDQTAPAAPQLDSPANNAQVNLPVVLRWIPDSGSAKDSLYIYKDSLQTAPILQLETSQTSYSFNDNTYPFYFWRLRSVDEAGNVGDYSGLRKFLVQ